MSKLSSQNSLQWICRRCLKAEFAKPEVTMVIAKDTELLKVCSLCGVENWCFPVTSGRLVKGAKSDTNTTDMAPEAESAEGTEAVEEAPTEAVEAVVEEVIEEEKQPEETSVEAVKQQEIGEAAILDAGGAVPTEEPLEAEPKPSAESIAETLDILKTIEQGDSYRELMIDPKADVTAEIAELEAKLAKLKPTK